MPHELKLEWNFPRDMNEKIGSVMIIYSGCTLGKFLLSLIEKRHERKFKDDFDPNQLLLLSIQAELTIVQKKPRLFIRQDFLIFFTNLKIFPFLKWGEKLGKTVSTLLTFTIQYFILGFLRVFIG